MTIKTDTEAFESWLHTQCKAVGRDLEQKHKRMTDNAFMFLRATFYRWARKVEKICPELCDAPAVLSVGDIHSENFGTWRDEEGRLVWGVNDFDEASVIPYAFDLVRLATSLRLAAGVPEAKFNMSGAQVATILLGGYAAGLAEPRPTLLDDHMSWMREYVVMKDNKRAAFWHEFDDEKKFPGATPPEAVADDLRASLPEGAQVERFTSVQKGGGSLGRPRYLAIARWRGGRIVREAKALVPSAWDWAHKNEGAAIRFADLATGRFRAPDPFLTIRHHFIVRRIAADSRKIDLDKLSGSGLDSKLIDAMGRDLAAVHAATDGAPASIHKDLGKRPATWLHDAAKTAAAAVTEDYTKWVNG
ncbi:MAG: DUF2252 family protein [Reyranellaceae bacterium]